jgi:hypothetical protein
MSERIQNVDQHEEIAYNGRKFRSKLEVQTAQTLDALGIPYQYEERKIELLEGFRCPYQKNKVKGITYKPDFIIGSIMLECKGFETPEWKIKKKYVFKWLMENEPDTVFYQIHDAGKSLVEMLDKHWSYLGMAIRVTSKPSKKKPSESRMFDSVAQAMDELNIHCSLGLVLSSLTGKREYVLGYKFELVKITL